MKAKLIFSADGKTVYIRFASGRESVYFESKEEALFAIHSCMHQKKLTDSEVKEMFEEIVLADRLPDRDPNTFIIPFAVLEIIQAFMEEESLYEQKIENPTVELCNCERKMKHAHIYNEKGEPISPPFLFKNDGLGFVQHLFKQERITEADTATLNTLIDMLELPEDVSLN